MCFGAVQVYLDGTPLKSSKDTLVHENVFYLRRSNVTDAVVYSFSGQLKEHNIVTVAIFYVKITGVHMQTDKQTSWLFLDKILKIMILFWNAQF